MKKQTLAQMIKRANKKSSSAKTAKLNETYLSKAAATCQTS